MLIETSEFYALWFISDILRNETEWFSMFQKYKKEFNLKQKQDKKKPLIQKIQILMKKLIGMLLLNQVIKQNFLLLSYFIKMQILFGLWIVIRT